ncbi:ShlB/FhaC/HecB family hemolysin secretion/activation protein [Bombella sp. ESL0378]|nr:ShlB/FhaC/HecB family hemolysin secretion/activation protein [Bombella sp. ESL0378]
MLPAREDRKGRVCLFLWGILLVVLLSSLTEPGRAEPSTPPVLPGLPAGPGSAQDQFQRFRQHQQQLDSLPPPTANVQIAPQPTPQDASPACMVIHKININGAQHLPAGELKHIATEYEGRCLAVKDLNALLNQLNAAYVKHGYITSRAYLPEQTLSSGTLTVTVVEGQLEGVDIQGRARRLVDVMAFPGLKGHILNLRDLEEGVEQMNRLPHFGAQMKISPGTKPGTSRVTVNAPEQNILHGQLWADNNGQKATGRVVGHALLSAENPLGLLDMWSVEYDHSLRGPDHGARGTSFLSANGSIPFGYWTFFGSWWQSQDAYPLLAGTDIYHLTGSRMDWQLGLSRTLWRNNTGVTTAQVSFERKSFGSQVDHTNVWSQSGRQAYVNANISESLHIWGSSWYITGGVKIGIDGAGSWNYYAHPAWNEPHRAYVKPMLDIDGYVPFAARWLWHTTMHGEVSSHDQNPTNELQVGGPYTVRGFLEQAFVGNNGGYMRNDLSFSPETDTLRCGPYTGFCRAFFKGVQFYGALDFGVVRAGFASRATPAVLKGGEMAGVGLGIRKASGVLFWDVMLTHAIARGPLPAEGLITFFSAGIRM